MEREEQGAEEEELKRASAGVGRVERRRPRHSLSVRCASSLGWWRWPPIRIGNNAAGCPPVGSSRRSVCVDGRWGMHGFGPLVSECRWPGWCSTAETALPCGQRAAAPCLPFLLQSLRFLHFLGSHSPCKDVQVQLACIHSVRTLISQRCFFSENV
jgi:hypothetical protein